jgi:penicillin-insensitive murein endopeptidase
VKSPYFLFNKTVKSIACLTMLICASPAIAGEAIGSAANGCLLQADSLPLSGDGYQVVRSKRERYFGHPALINFIQRMGHTASAQQWGTLLIGDLSLQRGGRMPYGHSSHQTGLDADILFGTATQPLDGDALSTPPEIEMVKPGGLEIDRRVWRTTQTAMLRYAAEQDETDRIFVHPAIKAELCKDRTENRAWLRKIRPWWGHTEHFHVRLTCPADSPDCTRLASLPEGDGCDLTLAWWLHAKPPVPTSPKSKPTPPAHCLISE